MARKKFAPSHSITGPMLFIPAGDGAWLDEQIDAETHDDKGKALPAQDEHPFWRYFHGETRYDLDAEGIREYLDPEKDPETWQIKALSMKQRHRVDALLRVGDVEGAQLFAFLRGCEDLIAGASNPAGEALAKALRAKKRKDENVVAAVEAYAFDVVNDVGSAIIRVSKDLTPQEKKLSGSSDGAGSPGTTT